MKSTHKITLMFVSALLVMGGCTGGSRVSEAGERSALGESAGVGESGKPDLIVVSTGDGESEQRGATVEDIHVGDSGERKMSLGNEGVNRIEAVDESDQAIVDVQIEVVKDGFVHISDVYVSPSGMIYAVDAMRHYLYRMDPESGVIDSVGGRGQGMTQFWGPVSVHASNDLKIFVQDAGNGRIQMFDRRFQFLGSLTMDGGPVVVSDDPTVGMVVNRAGGVVFWDEGGSRVVATTPTYTLDRSFNPDLSEIQLPPKRIRKSSDGFIVIDHQGLIIHRYADNGRRMGFLSGFGEIIDITTQHSEMIILTSEFIISTTSSGVINQILRHAISSPKTIVIHQKNVYIADRTTLYKVVI